MEENNNTILEEEIDEIESANDTMNLCRKVKLYPCGDKKEVDRVYKYLRDGMYNFNKAYNIYMTNMYSYKLNGLSTSELEKRGSRKPKEDDPEWSLYEFGKITFPVGLSMGASLKQIVKNDLSTAKKNGLFKGKERLPFRRMDSSLRIEKSTFDFYYNEENFDDFLKVLYTDKCEIYMKFVNDITFKVVLGNLYRSRELRNVFEKIFNGTYDVCTSSIEIDDKDIILNLSLKMPKNHAELREDIVLGVDLGLAIPAYCAVNVNPYERVAIGSKDDFLRVRTKIQAQRRRLQKALKYTSGGHGRKKKLKPLDRFADYESQWVQNYNHFVSKRVIDAALEAKAGVIHIEDLKGFGEDEKKKFVLRNWSYFQLQQYITYKAGKYGIRVEKVNPCYTSQVCSCCGHWEEGQRVSQSEFVCKNPKCENYGKIVNADYNAARNIARINDLSDGETKRDKLKERAMARIENGEWFN